MPETFEIKQGDTEPDLTVTLVDANGNAVDVSPTGTTVEFHMRPKGSNTAVVNTAAVVVDGPTGVVRHEWIPADTDEAGDFLGEFEVTRPDGQVESYPNDEDIIITIHPQVA